MLPELEDRLVHPVDIALVVMGEQLRRKSAQKSIGHEVRKWMGRRIGDLIERQMGDVAKEKAVGEAAAQQPFDKKQDRQVLPAVQGQNNLAPDFAAGKLEAGQVIKVVAVDENSGDERRDRGERAPGANPLDRGEAGG